MLRFLFGVAIGALGYWAYENGMLPFEPRQVFDQIKQGGGSQIVRPTPEEISGRPAAPIPS